MKSRRNRQDVRSLRSRAGRVASTRENHFEALEERKLLFSITITPDMDFDGDGLGTATGQFGYTVPYLARPADVQDTETEDVAEDFNDEGAGAVFNGRIFADSDIRVTHNFGFSDNFRIYQPDPQAQEAWLWINAVDGSFWTFSPRTLDQTTGQNFPRPATRASFDILNDGNGRGLMPNDFTVDFLFEGTVVSSYSGNRLIAANQSGVPSERQNGIGTFVFDPGAVFTSLRVTSRRNETVWLDNLSFTVPNAPFADIVDARIFGADFSFTAPIGATVQVLDLYGRDMVATLALGMPEGLDIPLVDLDLDGVPNFNDGIGQVRLSGVDSRASFTMFGGTIDLVDGAFTYTRTGAFLGNYDDLEQAMFGYDVEYDDSGQPTVFGLPGGPGSLVFGAPTPMVRANSSSGQYNPGGQPRGTGSTIQTGFNDPDQGVFVLDGDSIGSVYIHGVMHGSSQFSGSVSELYFGTLLGSINVQGDMGSLYVGSDAGLWISDGEAQSVSRVATGSQLTVARTAGEIAIGGRSQMNTTIVGDLTDAQKNPPRDPFRYTEREKTYAFDPGPEAEPTIMSRIFLPTSDLFGDFGLFVDPGGRSPIFNTTTLRNDTLMGAEFVGSIGTAVQIRGTIGFGDPINTDEDPVDVFAFVADGTSEVAVEYNSARGVGLIRIVDQNGRPLAATEVERGTRSSQQIRFRPSSPGVYYAIVSDIGLGFVDGTNGSGFSYSLTISGITPTTLGSYRVAGSTGQPSMNARPLLDVLNGDTGMIRIGTGYTTNGAADTSPGGILNDAGDGDAVMDVVDANLNLAGDLFAFLAGSDIQAGDLIVAGDLGQMYTGMNPAAGGLAGDGLQGDVVGLTMLIGGRVASVDIRGDVGIDQDADPDAYIFPIGLDLRSGRDGGDGSIGMIRIGGNVNAGTLFLTTSPGSVVGGLMVSQDKTDGLGMFNGVLGTSDFTLGAGSDIRFVDVPRIDLLHKNNAFLELFGGSVIELVDDGGGIVQISVEGALDPTEIVATIRFLPIDNGGGVAVARIEGVNLAGGRTLRISGVGRQGNGQGGDAAEAPISIGVIDIANADAQSAIEIRGSVEVDVLRIVQSGGALFDHISNLTPFGDLVSVDVIGLNTLTILTGDLGRTQVPEFGPALVGTFLGVAVGEQGTVGGALGVEAGALSPGTVDGGQRPVSAIGGVYLDDIGAPFDGYLNGLVVRTGNLQSVSVGGAVGDVILQGGGQIVSVEADVDVNQPVGHFDGIVGTIYAGDVNLVNVGRGLAATPRAPYLLTGIFATDEVRTVVASGLLHPGAFLSGVIIAANIANDPDPNGEPEVGGVRSIQFSGADIRDLYVGAMSLDDFRTSYVVGEGAIYRGTIGDITGLNGDMFRAEIQADEVRDITITGGAYDGSIINAGTRVGTLDFETVRNSTLDGSDFEFHRNEIWVGRNLDTFQATKVSDVEITVIGNVINTISAESLTRTRISVTNTLPEVSVTGNITASEILAGQLLLVEASAIRTSKLSASGHLDEVTAATEIFNTDIAVTGPEGEIGAITADTRITGSVSASGPIASISTTSGDINIRLVTTTRRGNVGELVAARDLILDSDISGTLTTIQAGRNIGKPGAGGMIVVHENLPELVAGGHLFTDVRVGEVLTSATIGRAVNTAGSPMGRSGSIYAAKRIVSVVITGDFGGGIVSYTNGIGSVAITDGSLLAGGRIAAYDGNVESVVINGGNLYGDIHSDWSIKSVAVNASDDGVFGDVGINPSFSAAVAYDANRGQLPPGVKPTAGQDGPVISARLDIESVVVSGGAMFETTIHAGRTLGSVQVSGDARSDGTPQNIGTNVFAAGGLIQSIAIGGDASMVHILAGVRSLGNDMLPGGFGVNADTTNAGSIERVSIGGDFTDSKITAGMNTGADKVYNTVDDRLEIGYSSVGPVSIGGSAAGSSVFADALLDGAKAGGKLAWGGSFKPVADGNIATSTTGTQLTKGSAFSFSTSAGSGTILLTGSGNGFFDASTSRVILTGTNGSSSLTVHANGTGVLTDFDIVSTEGASLGLIRVEGSLAGDSDIVIDEAVERFELGAIGGTGTIHAGRSIGAFVSGAYAGGSLITPAIGSVLVSGGYGDPDPDVRGEALMSFGTADSVHITGQFRGGISVQLSIGSLTADQGIRSALIRAGTDIGSITTSNLLQTRISAGDRLTTLAVSGDMIDSSLMVGGDLGDDAEIGGSGFNADTISSGFIGAVTIGGDFIISDIVAGVLRGSDGFFGTGDDRIASGRSSITSITIGGEALGSNRGSESYRIASSGTLGPVTAGGVKATNDRNFIIETVDVDPLPIQVTSLDVTRVGGVFVGAMQFNQAIDFASLDRALSISEVRGNGEIEIRLIQSVDYTLSQDASGSLITVTFAKSIVEKDLPQISDQPGPGVVRFTIEAAYIRSAAARAELDGNGDGQVVGSENFSSDNILGDAGDKFTQVAFDIPGGNGIGDAHVDMYGPVNLNIVFDSNTNSDGLPDANQEFVVRGAIGDHPDNNNNYFSFSSDVDLYAITLQAGQILRLGAMQGAAKFAGRGLVQPDGTVLTTGSTAYAVGLPVDVGDLENPDLTVGQNYLIRQTGTYYVYVGNTNAFLNLGSLPNIAAVAGGVGTYTFTVKVFDDGDSGFNAATTAGDGQDLINAPAPGAFAGNDGKLGTADDLAKIVKGPYVFRYSRGDDGVAGTADDLVSGSNGSNVTSITNALGQNIISVDAAIGDPGATGVPSRVEPDVDVFHLNGGNPIAIGTVVRVTLKLSDLGSDLGSRIGNPNTVSLSLANYVQFAIFDTTSAKGADDAVLVFSPNDASPNGGGEPGVIADSSGATYGYDENGDFYFEFVAPGRIDLPGKPASYAVYVQGVTNTDYRLEVVTAGSREIVRRKQNILLETAGGSVEWLEVGGITTPIGPFVASALGFTGVAPNGQQIDTFILDRVTEIMQGVLDSVVVGAGSDGIFGTSDDLRGLDVTVSTDPSDFEFQDFSTIFVSSDLDPIHPVFAQDGLFAFLANATASTTQPFGISQHVDAGNADRTDEAVIFVPVFTILGYTPSADDLEGFAQSLAAAATRRAGELMGLRFTQDYDPTQDLFDVMGANAVPTIPGDAGSYELPRTSRRLSSDEDSALDTDFFLGYQNAAGVLSLFVRDA